MSARTELRAEIIGAHVTLDGQRAIICGSQDRGAFVTVAALPCGPAYEWSIEAAARITHEGGRFTS